MASLSQRIKGLEVQLLTTQDGSLQESLVDVVDFDATIILKLISKGYLGEKSERKDYIFAGMKFKVTLHVHSQDYVDFLNAIVNKAKRLSPDTVFSFTGVFDFPNGDTPELNMSDCAFSEIPVSTKSRDDYVELVLQGECEDIDYAKS